MYVPVKQVPAIALDVGVSTSKPSWAEDQSKIRTFHLLHTEVRDKMLLEDPFSSATYSNTGCQTSGGTRWASKLITVGGSHERAG
jgi:hypothetical protein